MHSVFRYLGDEYKHENTWNNGIGYEYILHWNCDIVWAHMTFWFAWPTFKDCTIYLISMIGRINMRDRLCAVSHNPIAVRIERNEHRREA